MPTVTIARIALAVPLNKHFDYLIKDKMPVVGGRVRVPFGKQHKIGIVLELTNSSDFPLQQLKKIDEVLDDAPLFPNKLFKLIQWASRYYQYPLGDALSIVMPTALRQGKPSEKKQQKAWQLTELGKQQSPQSLTRAPHQASLLNLLQNTHYTHAEIIEQSIPASSINSVAKKGWIEPVGQTKAEPWLKSFAITEQKPKLNTEQAVAICAVNANPEFSCYLLDGITGSGKTEVYLNLLEPVLAKGKQALILVPEIGLTPQTINRFKRRFAVPVCALHSALNDTERLNAWLDTKENQAAIIIGTRSALFSPCQSLGIIIVDEEHDTSYKQQDTFRYHARDLAVMRGFEENIPVVLGSATPSFESLYNAQIGKYHHLSLTLRAGDALPPKLGIQDMRGMRLIAGISQPLIEEMHQHLQQHNQVMLFLNRRGYAPVLMCHECGWTAKCPRCDTHYTLHQKHHELRCHHCGSQRAIPHQCDSCGSTQLIVVGTGTEQLETELKTIFPKYSICRIDRDNTRRKGSLAGFLEAIHRKEYQILIGTQMLAKGHHFPDVTLVALVDVDGALFSNDFRAPERLAQLFIQVAGRAGRASKPGKVLLQTHHPEHPLLRALVHHGYQQFAEQNLQERQQTRLPPYSLFALFRSESHDSRTVEQFLYHVRNILQALPCKQNSTLIMGPTPAPMHRRAGKYRWQLVIQADTRKILQKTLFLALQQIDTLPMAKKVRWSLDIEPQDMS